VSDATFWSAGNIHDLELFFILMVLLALQLRFDLASRLKKLYPDYLWKGFGLYQVLSLSAAGGVVAALFLWTDFDQPLNVLRVGNFLLNGLGAGHWLDWLAISLVFVRFAGWELDLFSAAVLMTFFDAMHEAAWYVFYLIANPQDLFIIGYYYLPFLLDIGFFIAAYFLLVHFKQLEPLPWRTMAYFALTLVVFDSLWVIAGFPITVDTVTGGTPLFLDPSTNLVEHESWFMPALPLVFSRRGSERPA
jgi:hypothetical protein